MLTARIAHGVWCSRWPTPPSLLCNGKNERAVAAQASIVFLGSAKEGETLIAEAQEAATAGRGGVTRVAVRTSDGRAVAEFTGYSRSIGGSVIA